MKMEQTECCETSAYKIQTPRNYPEENIQRMDLITKIPKFWTLCILAPRARSICVAAL
jgi:hypothetical protein